MVTFQVSAIAKRERDIDLLFKYKSMLGKLNDHEIEDVLMRQIIGRVGCYGNGMIYIVPVNYIYDGSVIYARCFDDIKIDLIRKNPKVCFQVEIMENMANWKSVIAWGNFMELTETSKKSNEIQKLLADKTLWVLSNTTKLSPYQPTPPNEKPDKIEGFIFCIHLDEKSGRFETSEASAN